MQCRTSLPDPGRISPSSQERNAYSNDLNQADYAAARATLATLMQQCDALVSVTAAGGAPPGLDTTGDPAFVVPGSDLGLQLLRAPGRDAAMFSHAASVDGVLRG